MGKPRWARILAITKGSSMEAMIVTGPPQCGKWAMSCASSFRHDTPPRASSRFFDVSTISRQEQVLFQQTEHPPPSALAIVARDALLTLGAGIGPQPRIHGDDQCGASPHLRGDRRIRLAVVSRRADARTEYAGGYYRGKQHNRAAIRRSISGKDNSPGPPISAGYYQGRDL